MKLITLCSSCQKELRIKSSATTRAELQMEHGDEISITCDNCAKYNKKHLNRISAEVSNRIILLSIVVGLVATVVLFYFFGLIASIVLSIPIIVWQYEMKKAAEFNSYRIKR